MNIKTPLTIFIVVIILLGITLLTKYVVTSKSDEIIKQNDKEIIVREYKTSILLNKNLKKLDCHIDSTLWKYKPNKIIYNGTITKADHRQSKILIKTITIKRKNNKTYYTITTKNIYDFISTNFSRREIKEIENNVNKKIIITQMYYPSRKIIYQIQ